MGLHVRSVSHVLSESAYATGNLRASIWTRSYEQCTYILVLAPYRNDWDPAKREPFPASDGVGCPVSAILTLRCDTLIAFELAREVYRPLAWASYIQGSRITFGADDEEERHCDFEAGITVIGL